ncbi:cation acetate symporter, partial [Burkholderia pseudomallei]|nr:cation acetate symporter [Burkholderia pseudomallei]
RRRAGFIQTQLDRLPASYADARRQLVEQLADLRRHNGPLREINQRERELADFPRDPAAARVVWTQARDELLARAEPPVPMHEPFPAASEDERKPRERNFLALLLCLSLGTASLPHILTRYNTTTSVASARRSVGWTLFFIALFYLSVPVLAVMIKYEILANLVGRPFAALPAWVTQWHHFEPDLI